MEVRAVAKYIRMSAFKVRRIITLIRKRNVNEAIQYLKFTPGAAAPILLKLVKSAVANLKQKNTTIDENNVFIKTAFANEGATLKRMKRRSQGRANVIRKRTCNIEIVVSD